MTSGVKLPKLDRARSGEEMSDAFGSLNDLARQLTESYSNYQKLANSVLASQDSLKALSSSLRIRTDLDGPFLAQIPSILEASRLSSPSAIAKDLLSVNESLATFTAKNKIVLDMLADRSSLRDSIFAISCDSAATELLASYEATKLLRSSIFAQNRLHILEPHLFGNLIGAAPDLSDSLRTNLEDLTRGYRHLVETP